MKCITYALFLVCVFSPFTFVMLQAGEGRDETGSSVLWTLTPQRVDRSQQSLPRLPDKRLDDGYPDALYVPRSVRILDSVTFRVKGKIYRFMDVDPVPPAMICTAEDQQRWACGLRARLALRSVVAGRNLRCKQALDAGSSVLRLDCRGSDGARIASRLIRLGAAILRPGGPVDLTDATKTAVQQRAGIWRDAEFYKNNK